MNGIEDKTAIVFAGSRGIGRKVAERLAKEGASVVLTYVSNREAADEVTAEIQKAGGKAVAVKADVSDARAIKDAFDQAEKDFGNVDIVVNAAGMSVFGPFGQHDAAKVEQAFDINALGVFHICTQVSQRIAGNGKFVHLSTGGTKMAMPGGGVYAGSKAAGEHMVLGLAKEVGGRGVAVNVVSPGVTDTDGLVMDEEQVQGLIQQTPMGRLGQPDDVADAICLLCTDDARWITGQTIGVNGGIL